MKDNILYAFYLLREEMRKNSIELSTQDITPIEDAEIVIFNDMPAIIPQKKPGQRFYLIAFESIAVLPRNFNMKLYKHFDKVFTWKDDIVDNLRVFKINYSFYINPMEFLTLNDRKKMVSLVCNNKISTHNNELYSERIKVIEFFEQKHPEDLDLFGIGWDFAFGGYYIMKILEKFHLFKFFWGFIKFLKLDFLISKKYKCYRGSLSPKIPALRYYRFNICYENVYGEMGYITEKIFDCFFAGCIPIYLGAPNISDLIPTNCFIDKRNFKNYNDLYNFLKSMSEQEFNNYLKNISGFLKSEKAKCFTAEYFSEFITNNITRQEPAL